MAVEIVQVPADDFPGPMTAVWTAFGMARVEGDQLADERMDMAEARVSGSGRRRTSHSSSRCPVVVACRPRA